MEKREVRPKREIRVEIGNTPIPELPEELKSSQEFVFRWIRVQLDGEWDIKNIRRRESEGWVWVRSDEYSGLELFPAVAGGNLDGVVGIDDLALAKLPRKISEERKAMNERRAGELMQAVDNQLMRENDPRMPLVNESVTKVRRGKQAAFET